jgi:hypothetical protein
VLVPPVALPLLPDPVVPPVVVPLLPDPVVPPVVVPLLPVPVVPVLGGGELGGWVEGEGLGDGVFFCVCLAGLLLAQGVPAVPGDTLDRADWLISAAPPLMPGSGMIELDVGVGDGVIEGDAEVDADAELVDLGGGVIVGAGELELDDVGRQADLAGGLAPCECPCGVVRALAAASEPPPPPLLPCGADWLLEVLEAEEAEVVDMTCGSRLSPKPPTATTKTAMPMPATGRIQLYRGRAWPGLPVAGRKRSTTAQKAATTGSIHWRSRATVSADQADADSRDSIGRFIRSRIRSSPSADGSIDSAAACSARRSASS